jgi:hypothetical protein
VWKEKKGKDKWTEKRNLKLKRKCVPPVPSVHFAKATHDERASDRLDARTPWALKLSVSIPRFTVCVVLTRHLLLAPRIMLPCLFLLLTRNFSLSHSPSRSSPSPSI